MRNVNVIADTAPVVVATAAAAAVVVVVLRRRHQRHVQWACQRGVCRVPAMASMHVAGADASRRRRHRRLSRAGWPRQRSRWQRLLCVRRGPCATRLS
eukprot:COSAG01_NODE_13513_length_1574_cov_41.679322_1_plen_97_part_10